MHVHDAMLVASASLFLAPLLTGCSTTATISRINQPEIEAQIIRSDNDSHFVRTEGGSFEIPRSSVSDIDHPGNVAATIGAIITGYGIVNIGVGLPDCDRRGAAYCVGVFLPAAIGAPIFAWGLGTWMKSSAAAKPKPASSTNFAIVPTASFDKKNEYIGVSASARF
jgi:hypothetical protein